MHKIEKRGKLYFCEVCKQSWTSSDIRSKCPGVQVYPYGAFPAYLKTETTLKRERKFIGDRQPDGAYRILKSPYFRYVYDERKIPVKVLTEKQLATQAKREQTLREKYTCRFCEAYYTDRYDRQAFNKEDHVCHKCQHAIRRYNSQIFWARALIKNETIVLDIRTSPEIMPYSMQEKPSLLIGYTAISLATGEVLYEADMSRREDLWHIEKLVCPKRPDLLVPCPSVLSLYPSALYAVRFELQRNAKGVYLFNPNLHELLVNANLEYVMQESRPISMWGHRDLPIGREITSRQLLEEVSTLHHVEPVGSTVNLMRSLVLHLSSLEPVRYQGQYIEEEIGN